MNSYYIVHLTSEEEINIETYAVVKAESYGQAEKVGYCLPWEELEWSIVGEDLSKELSHKLRDAHFKDFCGDNDCLATSIIDECEITRPLLLKRIFANMEKYNFDNAIETARNCYDDFDEID